VVVPSFDRVHTQQLLVEARKMAAKGQREGSHQGIEFGMAYIGDLGHFCEEVSRTWADQVHSLQNSPSRTGVTKTYFIICKTHSKYHIGSSC
jgi:hypothetical protein